MYRLIMNAPKGMVVDHYDGNGLNNCRANLRICTRQQNAYNSRRSGGTSQFKGVHFEKATGKWRATITLKGEHFDLGLYDDEVEAARAYDRKAIELFGEFAYLNFPEEHGRDAHPGTPGRRQACPERSRRDSHDTKMTRRRGRVPEGDACGRPGAS